MDPMVLGCFGVSPFQKPSFAYDNASTKGLQRWWSHNRHTSFVGWFNVSTHKIDREIKKSTYRWKEMENRWKQKPFHVVIFGGADKDRTDLHGASPLFIAAKYGQAQSFSAMAVFIPLQKFQETLKYLWSLFLDCFILFRIKDLLEINCRKKPKKHAHACPFCLMPTAQPKENRQSFPQLGGHAAILTGSQSGQRFLWPAWRDPFVGSLWFAKKTSLCFVL